MLKKLFLGEEPKGELIKKIEIPDLVDKNYNEYYKAIFEEFEKNGNKKSFNKGALLTGPFWYIYRKMTFRGIGIIALQVIVATVAFIMKNPLWIGMYIATYLTFVHTGFYGNHIYYNQLKKLKKESETIDNKFKWKFLRDKSGVDGYITGCWVVGTVIIYLISYFL